MQRPLGSLLRDADALDQLGEIEPDCSRFRLAVGIAGELFAHQVGVAELGELFEAVGLEAADDGRQLRACALGRCGEVPLGGNSKPLVVFPSKRVASNSPVAAFQMRTMLSLLSEITCLPSDENATNATQSAYRECNS